MEQYLATFVVDIFRLCVTLVLLMIVFVPLEKLCALRPQKVFRKGFGADVFYYFLSSLAPKLVLVVPITIVAVVVHRFVPSAFYASIARMPLAMRLGAAMIVGEIGAYWAHRWSHENRLLWSFHKVHHSAEEIDWLVNSRAHPVDLLFTRLCEMIPMYILGLAQPTGTNLDLVPVLVTVAATMWGFFIHANLKWRFGFLEWIISTPAFHHWHHTNDGPEYVNKNYAAMLPLVDKLFGTFYLPKTWPEKYGIDAPSQVLKPLPPCDPPALPMKNRPIDYWI
jgi:sterol desaturase/sphingolipid hydroxylase (fatty acid hydroxylase superfamily)